MKNKLNRILPILALVVLSGTPLFTKSEVAANADLASPTSFDYAYEYYSDGFYLTQFDGEDYLYAEPVLYTRTTDSTYFNYTTTVNGGDGFFDFLPEGLDITMTFNRSNTSWQFITGEGYFADDTKIGSNSSVGNVFKWDFTFNNQTKNNYRLYLDLSSTGTQFIGTQVIGFDSVNYYYNTNLNSIFIPSFTSIRLYVPTASLRYFDAWYLQDLGISDSYDNGSQDGYNSGYSEGLDDGYQDGLNNSPSVLWDGLEVVVGVSINFILFIMTLSIFDISLLNIGIVLVSVLGIIWVLKALRG